MKHLLAFLFILLLVGCGPSKQVSRISEDTTTDLSGDWNDTDSRLVADEMIRDVLGQPWLEDYVEANSKKPTVIVGRVLNRSHEHIETKTFIKNLERALLNSGKVEFVASADEREQVRTERKEQAKHASEETAKAPGQETGADFMLIGTITSIIDQEGGQKVKFYQTNLELVNIETNKKVWIGEKKIKKMISQDRYKL
ncbi:MAG TPA: penicillin-binding protein activator LpoB [Bacteroidota bacterium]|nr:penicillin-binding protein activator LpoB [Bacteroidota bacterium]